jgi:hypothetical protein
MKLKPPSWILRRPPTDIPIGPANGEDPRKLDVLKILIEVAEKESDRFWTRHAAMLYVNTGLLAILSVVVSLKAALVALRTPDLNRLPPTPIALHGITLQARTF